MCLDSAHLFGQSNFRDFFGSLVLAVIWVCFYVLHEQPGIDMKIIGLDPNIHVFAGQRPKICLATIGSHPNMPQEIQCGLIIGA